MALRGELLSRPTYEALKTLQGGAINLAIGVYRHKVLDKDVVQKTIDMAGRQDAAAYKEPRLLDSIRHDHVVPVFEAQYDPETPDAITFVMPYYGGGSVQNLLLDDYRFSIDQARTIAIEILDALDYVHGTLGYVHRDVKPGNVLLGSSQMTA